MGYKYNQPYILENGIATECPRSKPGNVRPDFYHSTLNHLVEVKNYNITTASSRSNLVNTIIRQYQERIKVFPEGLRYEVQIDVRGQNYTESILQEIKQNILNKSNNAIDVKFIENE